MQKAALTDLVAECLARTTKRPEQPPAPEAGSQNSNVQPNAAVLPAHAAQDFAGDLHEKVVSVAGCTTFQTLNLLDS